MENFYISLFVVMEYISTFGFGLCSILVFGLLWQKIKHIYHRESYSFNDFLSDLSLNLRPKSVKIATVILTFCLFATLLTSSAFQELLGIHNLKTDNNGTYCYYIELSDEINTYTVPASIRIEQYKEDSGKKMTFYYLNSAVLQNNRIINFDDEELEIGISQEITDTTNKDWCCELLNRHAYSPQIEEDSRITFFSVFILLIKAFVLFITIISLLKTNRESNDY